MSIIGDPRWFKSSEYKDYITDVWEHGGASGLGVGGSPPLAQGHVHSILGGIPVSIDNERRFTEQNLGGMLSSRMGWSVSAPPCPHRKVVSYKLTDEKVVVFVVHENKALVFEDEAGLYPSDALVTQLRLLAEAA